MGMLTDRLPSLRTVFTVARTWSPGNRVSREPETHHCQPEGRGSAQTTKTNRVQLLTPPELSCPSPPAGAGSGTPRIPTPAVTPPLCGMAQADARVLSPSPAALTTGSRSLRGNSTGT